MLIVIPARYDSTRFPGKPLAPLLGHPLIQWTWHAASKVEGAEVVVATDDERIQKVCEGFGANVIRTSKSCRNGTERVAEAVAAMSWHATTDVVVNWQGDAPLIPPRMAGLLCKALASGVAGVATPVMPTLYGAATKMPAGHVEPWVNETGQVLWFERATPLGGSVFAHVGMYAYTTNSLRHYGELPETRVERRAGLEQLRWLVSDILVQGVVLDPPMPFEVNVPSDVALVETVLRARGERP